MLDFRTVLELPNPLVEMWLQYAAQRGKKPAPVALSDSAQADMVRTMFGSKGVIKA